MQGSDQSDVTVQPEPQGIELFPVASMLMQSLRSVGYSPATAVADLVDNSIAAGAHTVSISVAMYPHAFVAVTDDGDGMDEATLLTAMRFGSRDPRDARDPSDLGRFGLGLKTASLSQCRRLTVASIRNGELVVARWDLDEVDRRGWWLERPRPEQIPKDVRERLLAQGRGTAVIWEKLDRLETAGGERTILDAADHLALVFHRYLGGELRADFSILLNDRRLEYVDPFLEGHARGQELHSETITIDGHSVAVSPFVLPFPSRMRPDDLARIGGRESLATQHGFYIYRGGRLVVAGGWYRIVPSDDLIRLARIRVDVPIELDHLWKIDIRKAIAEPPPALRPHLRRIVGGVASRSRNVFAFKGIPANPELRIPIWQRRDMRDDGACWHVNREHPNIRALLSDPVSGVVLEHLLRLLEQNLPIQDIHVHTVNDQLVAEPPIPDEQELEEMARKIAAAFADQPEVAARILEKLPVTEPFNRNPDASLRIARKLAK